MALEEVFGSWRSSLCLLGGCLEGMGAGSELTGIAVGGVIVGVKRVCCFVLLNRYWGIVTVPGSILKEGDLGLPDPHPPP